MGEGSARTYVTHDCNGRPVAIGIYFTAGAWDGLPSAEEAPHVHFPLDIPEGTPFVWAGVDWANEGHPPPGVYDVPHLDVHFYMMDEATVHEIPPDEDYQVALGDDQHPPDYIRSHEVVPMMGEHLIDPTAPEFHGDPFTHTLIWGAYDGDLTFYEPMITVEFLDGLTGEERAEIKTPDAFPEASEYPTRYAVMYHPDHDAYTASLECFKAFPASTGVTGDDDVSC